MKRTDLVGLAEIFARNPDLQRRNRHLAPNGSESPLKEFDPRIHVITRSEAEKQPPQTRKYRNKVVEDAEHGRFDSQKEFKRFLELKLLEKAGEIANLRRQDRISLDVNQEHICDYVSDFRYIEKIPNQEGKWRIVIEDVKSPATKKLSTYRIKKKLVKALYGIEIRET